MRLLFFLVTLAVLSTGIAPAHAAGRQDIGFDVRLRGVIVGSFQLSIRQGPASYGVEARIRDAGLLSVLRSFSYTGVARGALRARAVPAHFEDVTDTGRRKSRAVLDYERGVPRVTEYASSNPAAPDAPDPATQGDTIDPTTALFLIFRDQPADTACGGKILMYDGMRRSHVVLGKPRRDGDVLRCTGEYRRLQGFTAKELARNVAFPMELTFSPVGDGLVHVTHAAVESSYGLVTLDRR